jgi:hypothetical protein
VISVRGGITRYVTALCSLSLLFMCAYVKADVYGPLVSTLRSASDLIMRGGEGPGKREMVLNGVPMNVTIAYQSARPLKVIEKLEERLSSQNLHKLTAYENSAEGWVALLRVPADTSVMAALGPADVGLSMAWRASQGAPTTVWDVEFDSLLDVARLLIGGNEQKSTPRIEYMNPPAGEALLLDLVDIGPSWLSHTRIYEASMSMGSRVDHYDRLFAGAGFSESYDAGDDGSSWLKTYEKQGSVLSLYARAGNGDSVGAMDIIQFHTMRSDDD